MFPKLIERDGFFIPTYGILVAIAFLLAIWLTTRLARKAGLDVEKVTNLAIYCALSGMLGAKLMMFLFDWRIYLSDPSQIFSFSTIQAAGVYQGGLLLALVVAFWYMRRVNLPAFRTCDVFAPGVALGHAVGRLGCFAAGCCWGQECKRGPSVTFTNPDAHELTGVPLGIPLYPTQVYESLLAIVVFAVLYWRFHKPHRDGSIIGLYMVLYSIARFLVEFIRHHDQALPFGGPLSLTQWISVGTFFLGLWLWRKPAAVVAPPKPAVSR
jgi:phosphatidylglycerol:prolipoprotein diacylglycerol transferase